MIVGMGVDMAETSRIQEAVERHGERFLQRVFTPKEIEYCQRHRNRYERFAARFAAKEAAMKALGTGWRRGITWQDFEISNRPGGKPCLAVFGAGARDLSQPGRLPNPRLPHPYRPLRTGASHYRGRLGEQMKIPDRSNPTREQHTCGAPAVAWATRQWSCQVKSYGRTQ